MLTPQKLSANSESTAHRSARPLSTLVATTSIIFAGMSFSSGCSVDGPQIERYRLTDLPEKSFDNTICELIRDLNKIEQRLDDVETMRIEAIKNYGMLLLIPELNERYELALTHHRKLMSEVAHRKEALITTNPDTQEYRTWIDSTDQALSKVLTFIDYVKQHHRAPYGWSPPEGFEYLRTITLF